MSRRVEQPVAGIILRIRAEETPFPVVGERAEAAIGRLERGQRLALRQERQSMSAAAAAAVFEIQDVAARLADEELQRPYSGVLS